MYRVETADPGPATLSYSPRAVFVSSPVSLQLAVGHSFMLLRFVTLPSLNN